MSKKKGKKGKQQEVDDSTQQIMRFYIRKINSLGIAQNKPFAAAVALAIENQEDLVKFHHVEDEIGPNAVRGIMEALCDLPIPYKHLADLWFVKSGLTDEGVKYITAYVQRLEKFKVLNLTNNEITAEGCEHIGICIGPNFKVPLQELTLDFNPIGCAGMEKLAQGLYMNQTIQKLSLNYCNLELESVKYLQQILSFINSDLRYLYLEGNYLRNEGIYQLFRALEANEWLEELHVGNNQFGECEDIPVVEKICEVLTKSNSIQVYDFKGNALYDDSIKKFLECIKMYKVVCRFEVPFLIQKSLLEELKKTLKKRKRKKKKKKKKGKKGKKKAKK